MFLVSFCSCLRSIHWSQVLSWEWRCSWSSADRRCSNYIWVISNFIAYQGAIYIRGFTVYEIIITVESADRITPCLFGATPSATTITPQPHWSQGCSNAMETDFCRLLCIVSRMIDPILGSPTSTSDNDLCHSSHEHKPLYCKYVVNMLHNGPLPSSKFSLLTI